MDKKYQDFEIKNNCLNKLFMALTIFVDILVLIYLTKEF